MSGHSVSNGAVMEVMGAREMQQEFYNLYDENSLSMFYVLNIGQEILYHHTHDTGL